VTASAEEAVTFSALLARSIAVGGRLRHERDWRLVSTPEEVLQRLEESRRICLAYLAAWPDVPDLKTTRIVPAEMKWPAPNAFACCLLGLMHWHMHLSQMQNVAEQARAQSLGHTGMPEADVTR